MNASPPGTGTSEALRNAALTLFAEQGYELTTMRHIAEAVGIRAPSIYNHVSSKQALLAEIMQGTMDALLAGFRTATRPTSDPIAERLRRAVEAHVSFHAQHRREAFIGNREINSLQPEARTEVLAKRRRYERGFRRLIQQGARSGELDVVSPKLTSFALLEMGIGVATWYREDGPLDVRTIASNYGELALRLVGAAPAATKPARAIEA